MEHVSKLLLDDTTITKLLTSIACLTCLVSLSLRDREKLSLRDCENLMSLPRTFFSVRLASTFLVNF